MTLTEFMQLPQAIRLNVIYDVLRARLVTMPVPSTATAPAPTTPTPTPEPAPSGDVRPPKYDGRLARKGGFQWMSEMLLADLIWWHAKKLEGAKSGGQYAAKDQKTAAELERFIAWRRVAPSDTWRGVRGDAAVTADPPSRDPVLQSWEDRAPARLAPPPPSGGYGDLDYGSGYGDDPSPF